MRNYQNPAHTLLGIQGYGFRTIVDVGANTGQFARKMQPRFPDAVFYCFEPTPAAYSALHAWATTQEGVNAINLALGETQGVLTMNLHVQHDTSSSLLATTREIENIYPMTASQSKVDVEIQRLDDYLKGLHSPLAHEILLKLDVQGYEAQVLRGAPDLLKQVCACIVEVNIDELYVGQSRFTEIVDLLGAGGLRYAGNFDQAYGQDGHVIYVDALFIRHAPASIDSTATSD